MITRFAHLLAGTRLLPKKWQEGHVTIRKVNVRMCVCVQLHCADRLLHFSIENISKRHDYPHMLLHVRTVLHSHQHIYIYTHMHTIRFVLTTVLFAYFYTWAIIPTIIMMILQIRAPFLGQSSKGWSYTSKDAYKLQSNLNRPNNSSKLRYYKKCNL